MNRWTISMLLLVTVFIMLLLSAGCSKDSDSKNKAAENNSSRDAVIQVKEMVEKSDRLINYKEVTEVTVYFLTENDDYLVPLTIPVNPTDKAAKAALQRLIIGPNDEFLKPVINTSTKIKDLYLKDDIVHVDFTNHFLSFPSENASEMAVISVLKSIEPFIDGRKVQLLVEGNIKDLQLGDLNLGEPLRLPIQEVNQGEKLITLYYVDPNGMYLVPVTKVVANPDPVTAAVLELAKGPGEKSGLIPALWPGTRVLGVQVLDNLANVNLSIQALGYGGGSAAESLFVKSILLTVTEFAQIEQVQLFFEGERLDYLPEGTEVGKPLSRPEHINFKN